MAAPLTPGLTPRQQQRIADALTRVGRVPLGQLTHIFMDADRAAVRALNPVRPSADDCHDIARAIADEHHVDPVSAAFAFGQALGIRQCMTFISPPKRRAKKADAPAAPTKPTVDEVAICKRWTREAGKRLSSPTEAGYPRSVHGAKSPRLAGPLQWLGCGPERDIPSWLVPRDRRCSCARPRHPGQRDALSCGATFGPHGLARTDNALRLRRYHIAVARQILLAGNDQWTAGNAA
jgi:hypothetical protein